MRHFLALLILLSCTIGSVAAEIRRGAIMTVKPMSIWFEQAAQLEEWQQKKKGDAKAFEEYQEQRLHAREAWQFINPLKVKIAGYNPKQHRVYVEMLGKGRFEGVMWFVDSAAIRR